MYDRHREVIKTQSFRHSQSSVPDLSVVRVIWGKTQLCGRSAAAIESFNMEFSAVALAALA